MPNTTHKISEAMSSQEPQAEMNFSWTRHPTRVYYSEELGCSFAMTATGEIGGIHRLDFPIAVTGERMVRLAVSDAWGCGPYSITEIHIFGSCAIFYNSVNYSN